MIVLDASAAVDWLLQTDSGSGHQAGQNLSRGRQNWESMGQWHFANVVWYVVKACREKAGLEHIAPHDLRRTCAKQCHSNDGEIEQIQFLLGHASVQTTERYSAVSKIYGTQ